MRRSRLAFLVSGEPLVAASQGHDAVAISVAIGTLEDPICYRHSRREMSRTLDRKRTLMSRSLYLLQTHAGFGRPQVSPVPSSPAKSPLPGRDKEVAYVSRPERTVLSHLIARCLCDVPRQEPGATLRGMSP